jgi:hypothetical protein
VIKYEKEEKMKKYSAEFFGHSVLFARKSGLFSISLFRRWGMRRCSLARVVFPALLLLIFSLTVLGGTAAAATEGSSNNFFGTLAGASNTGGSNSFFGAFAGTNGSSGSYNSFFGNDAGHTNTTGYYNAFFGALAGNLNTTGFDNAFFGANAGNGTFGVPEGSTGSYNSFFGSSAGYHNTSGMANSFFGYQAGYNNTTGTANSFYGRFAGSANTVEVDNTFIGHRADLNPGANPATNPVTNATAIGNRAYVAQSNSLVLGSIAGANGATANVNIGIGTPAPVRQLHLKGDNAVFRMDRSMDTAAFMLVRTDAGGTPQKTFVVGTNASGANTGEFVINDLGSAVAGGGTRRMTITNNGAVDFMGFVSAPAFFPMSSIAFKTNVRTYENALETVKRLRGVHFDWKESGKPSVGLIAEEVEGVVPEVVAHGGNGGAATGVNYSGLVGVLVEAVKEQQIAISKQQEAIFQLMAEIDRLKSRDVIAQR